MVKETGGDKNSKEKLTAVKQGQQSSRDRDSNRTELKQEAWGQEEKNKNELSSGAARRRGQRGQLILSPELSGGVHSGFIGPPRHEL